VSDEQKPSDDKRERARVGGQEVGPDAQIIHAQAEVGLTDEDLARIERQLPDRDTFAARPLDSVGDRVNASAQFETDDVRRLVDEVRRLRAAIEMAPVFGRERAELLAEIAHLRSDAWLERAAAEIASSPPGTISQPGQGSGPSGRVVAILKTHRNGKA
jgi:hypothetical protein